MSEEELIREAARLRGLRKFSEAISLIETNMSTFRDLLVVGLLEAFYAAKEMSDVAKAKALAREVAAIEPNTPSIQPYL